jgi:hypothetical protein
LRKYAVILLFGLIVILALRVDASNVELQAQRLSKLPDQWVAFEMPPLFERKRPFLQYGPYSFSVDTGRSLFFTDDERQAVIMTDWSGKKLRHFTASMQGYKGRFSDVVYHRGLLYAGCAQQPRIFVFDTKTGEVVRDIVLDTKHFRDSHERERKGPLKWAEPIVTRIGVDKYGRIHVAYWTVSTKTKTNFIYSERSCWKATLDYTGKPVHPDQEVPRRVTYGVVNQEGEWFYREATSVRIDARGASVDLYHVMKLDVSGRSSVFDDLHNFMKGVRGDCRALLGFDMHGALYGVVTLFTELLKHEVSHLDPGPYLVKWDRSGKREILGKIGSKPGNLRAPGARTAIVGQDGSIYILLLDKEPKKSGERLNLWLAQLWPRD